VDSDQNLKRSRRLKKTLFERSVFSVLPPIFFYTVPSYTRQAKRMSDKQEPNGGKGTAANITDQERDWAQQALVEYEQKNYKSCLEHLQRIQDSRPNDPKVLLNKAIVEFYENGLCTADKFQKSFVDVCKQVI